MSVECSESVRLCNHNAILGNVVEFIATRQGLNCVMDFGVYSLQKRKKRDNALNEGLHAF